MEKVYYKGYIVAESKLQKVELLLGDLKNIGISKISDDFKNFVDKLKYNVVDELDNILTNTFNNDILNLSNPIFGDLKEYINNCLVECYIKKYLKENLSFTEIIFEVITTKSGELYGKELHTGLLFPIVNKDKIKYKIMRNHPKNTIKKVDTNEIFFVESDSQNYSNDSRYTIKNTKDTLIAIYYEDKKYRVITPHFYNNACDFKAYVIHLTTYTIVPIINEFENLSLCESIIFNPIVANQNEVNQYLSQTSGFATTIFGVKKKIFNRIRQLYNKNVFSSQIEEKEVIKEVIKPKIEKDKMTLKLENIEYLLAVLKTKNIKAYEEFFKEYSDMLASETSSLTLNPLTIENLSLLEGRIEIYLEYAKNDVTHISELLSNLKSEYLKKLQTRSDEITKLTIPDIDKINELFLKTKSQYSIKDALMIQKDIAFLYIMELIEDKDIKVSDLENSYFIDNLKYIIITIMALIEEGILENNTFIDYEANLDLYSVFNIIRNLEINKNNQKTNKKSSNI